jgi:hypothetical protein
MVDWPTVRIWYEPNVCFVTFAFLLMLSLYKRLAPNQPLENFTAQQLTNDLYKVYFARLENLRAVLTKFPVSLWDCVTLNTLLRASVTIYRSTRRNTLRA